MAVASNTLITSSLALKTCIAELRNAWTLVPRAVQNIDPMFTNSTFSSGATVTIKIPPRFLTGTGSTVVKNDTIVTSTTLTVTQRNGAVGFTTKDLTLSLGDFGSTVARPLMAQFAADIESDGYAAMLSGAQGLVTPGAYTAGAPAQWSGADIATLEPFNTARARLKDMAASGTTYAAVTPSAMGKLAFGAQTVFNPTSAVSDQYLTGVVKRYGDFEFVESQSVQRFTSGTRASTGATVNGAITSGTSVILAGAGNAKTYVVGDQFTVAGCFSVNPLTRASTGKLQVFTNQTLQTSSAGGAVTLEFLPAVVVSGKAQTVTTAGMANGNAVISYGGVSETTDVNMCWVKDALLFAAPDLSDEMNGAGAKVTKARDSMTGLTLRLTKYINGDEDEVISRLDTMYGWKVIRPLLVVRVQG